MLKSSSLLSSFNNWIRYELWINRWIIFTREHQFLPDHHALTVCIFIEIISHVHTTSPNSDDIEIRSFCGIDHPANFMWWVHTVWEVVHTNLTGSFDVDRHIVYQKVKWVTDKFHMSQAHFYRSRLFYHVWPQGHFNVHIIQNLISEFSWPPKFWVVNCDFADIHFLNIISFLQSISCNRCFQSFLYLLSTQWNNCFEVKFACEISKDSDLCKYV